MEPDLRVRVTERGLRLADGRELPLLSGAIHYWRLRPERWADCLRAMQGLGFRMVETYVPWREHESAAGELDFSSCVAFLELVHELGMTAIVRPGPHINAEMTGFGFPDRVLGDESMLARTARGTKVWMPAPPRMFPAPSYASQTFRAAASEFVRRACEAMAPLRWPHGPIVAVQVDNEFQMFFRLGAYDQDYHPDALAWWAEVSGGREAPRKWDPANEATCLAWVEFKDTYAARSLAWVDDAIAAGGLVGIPGLHNLPPTAPELACLPRLEQAISRRQEGVVGVDFYQRNREYRRYRRRALYLAGSARSLPYAPEVGLGGALWIEPMPADEQSNVMRGLLMGGVRAMNLYMAVERERWYGAPISEEGERVGELAPHVERLLSVWNEVGWERLRRRARVAVVMSRTATHLAVASSLAEPITPVLLALGLGRNGPAALSRVDGPLDVQLWMDTVSGLLDQLQVPYVWVDEAVSPERLEGYDLVILPVGERVRRDTWQSLGRLGGRVVWGPGRPSRDELGQAYALEIPGRHLGEAAALAQVLEPFRRRDWVPIGDAPVDTDLFEDEGGTPRVLFAANRSDGNVQVQLRWRASLRDAFSDASLEPRDGLVDVELAPGEVRMFIAG